MFYVPTYINILQAFAFCRIDDLTWGTKGLDKSETDITEKEWERKKYILLLQDLSRNIVLSYLVVRAAEFPEVRNFVILGITILVSFLLLFRLVFAAIYLVRYNCQKMFNKYSDNYIIQNKKNGHRIKSILNTI